MLFVGQVRTVLFPQSLFVLIACSGVVTKLMIVSKSQSFHLVELFALQGKVGLVASRVVGIGS
jgi:hypothetical protein